MGGADGGLVTGTGQNLIPDGGEPDGSRATGGRWRLLFSPSDPKTATLSVEVEVLPATTPFEGTERFGLHSTLDKSQVEELATYLSSLASKMTGDD